MTEYERVSEEIDEAIDYYDHRLAELIEDRQRELGNPKFMEIADLIAKARGEAINQILSLDGIEIRADKMNEQEFKEEIASRMYYERHPLGNWSDTTLHNKVIARKSAEYIFEVMLKAGFIRVIPKPKRK